MAAKSTELCYKGHPLRRKDNLLYYGSMADKYIIMMQIRDRVVKKTEKDGLYNAMDVAAVWLDRALANN